MIDPLDPGTADLSERRDLRPRAIGAYVFAGGFTLGVLDHFDVACHLEGDSYGVATARVNFPNLPIHVGMENWPLDELAKQPWDFIFGNPPCAAWSVNNYRSGEAGSWRKDPRVQCTLNHFSLLEKLRPKVWAWESVTQAPAKGREFVDELILRAKDLGYEATELYHDAQWLGVPQVRRRWFLVLHRVGFSAPSPNYAPPTTAGEALAGVQPEGPPAYDSTCLSKFDPVLEDLAPGELLKELWNRMNPEDRRAVDARGRTVGRPAFGHKRLHPDKPSTATVGYAFVHPVEHRFMSVNEVQALAGFPQDFKFLGSTRGSEQLDLIARGVCPPVGSWLASRVRAAVETRSPAVAGRVSVVDHRKPGVAQHERSVGVAKTSETASEAEATYQSDTSLCEHDASWSDEAAEASLSQGTFIKENLDRPSLIRDVRPREGLGSGAYIRLLLSMNYQTEAIVEMVRRHYPQSKAMAKDVAWNRAKMRKDGHVAQPTRSEKLPGHVDPDRKYDTTALKRGGSQERTVHRDYAAHFFRWGFAGRFINGETNVLDVGCGVDLPLVAILNHPRSNVPRSYTGVDYNREPRKVPNRQWATYHWEFDFIQRGDTLGQFDLVTCFEVLEHVRRDDGLKFLEVLGRRLRPEGKILLSTPVFNGRAAANHLHEWEIDELREAVEGAGLRVEARYGTFASWNDVKRAAPADQVELARRLSEYYSGEVVACFLAPLYPDASRNNVWVLRRG